MPRAERKIEGVGLRDANDCAQADVLGLMTGFRVVEEGVGRVRRAIA